MELPDVMQAAVYRGPGTLRLESVPVPSLEDGEVLVRVAACGVCGTDLKKVALGLVEPPRIFGHETAGTIVATRGAQGGWAAGDRVALYHHVPDRRSWYGRRRLYAQCPQYRKTGITAGFEPSGGGYAEYVRVMPWIVREGGLAAIPDDVDFERAALLEPVNTCLKAVRSLDLDEGDVVLVTGLGSIGLILLQLAIREGAEVIGSDPLPGRRALAEDFGAEVVDPHAADVGAACRTRTEGRGADRALVAAAGEAPIRDAAAATRPGATILLFANTHLGEEATLDVGDLCVGEKRLVGSYSASIDLADEAARIVFDGEIDLDRLITHRFPLQQTAAAFERAAQPADDVGKVMVVQDEARDD